MPDICMCKGDGCEAKGECYRYLATPTPFRQSYFAITPGKDSTCKYFEPVSNRATKQKGKQCRN